VFDSLPDAVNKTPNNVLTARQITSGSDGDTHSDAREVGICVSGLTLNETHHAGVLFTSQRVGVISRKPHLFIELDRSRVRRQNLKFNPLNLQ
jgi:hypothetical protein